MTEKIKIFLGDLTYNTISLSTEVFPLNIGYIASYCIKRFNDFVDIRLFKYIDDLENAIYESPPDILGLSNYAWCHNISKEMFKLVLEKNPFTLTVWGGPNFPQDLPSQQEFMDKMKGIIDVYVPIEGELGFSNLVEKCIHVRDRTKFKEITASPINGCISRNDDGKIVYGLSDNRINELDEIPSPYLEGLLDKFFDGKLSPIIQTNRGCPFSCTFCTDGSENVSRVNNFSIKRVEDEIEYIAKKIPKNIHSMTISDLNFGMWPRDLTFVKSFQEYKKSMVFQN